MKLKTFLADINKLIDKEPGALDLEVYYGVDDEGNDYYPVHFAASMSLIEDGEIYGMDESDEYPHAEQIIIIN